MATTKKSDKNVEITVTEIQQGIIDVLLLGTSPLILNAMSNKAKHELLLPKASRKTQADKAASLKHQPLQEFIDSAYHDRKEDAPTRIILPATTVKGALRTAALDLPGSSKTQIGRLTYIEGDHISIYGVPQIMLSIVRMADAKRTPDVRTRAILPRWACRVSVAFTRPMLREQSVLNLLAAAGVTVGIGDWRSEKGSGNYGQFRLVERDNPDWHDVVANGGRAQQDAALADPEAYDSETEELLRWFNLEIKRRGIDLPAPRQLREVA